MPGAHGELNSQAKLTWQEVEAIRLMAGTRKQLVLARRFGVSQKTISHVLNRRSWRHPPLLTAPPHGLAELRWAFRVRLGLPMR